MSKNAIFKKATQRADPILSLLETARSQYVVHSTLKYAVLFSRNFLVCEPRYLLTLRLQFTQIICFCNDSKKSDYRKVISQQQIKTLLIILLGLFLILKPVPLNGSE